MIRVSDFCADRCVDMSDDPEMGEAALDIDGDFD
jgi:hypothetical protein